MSLIKCNAYTSDGATLSVFFIRICDCGCHRDRYAGEEAVDESRKVQWTYHAFGERLKVDAVRSVPFRTDYANGSLCFIFRSAPVTQRADSHASLNPSLMKTPPL